jgi:GT2 family glycosyltransferase
MMNRGGTLLVVVLYRTEATTSLRESQTLRCLESAWATRPDLTEKFQLLLWDNSPESTKERLRVEFQYHHAAVNDGVSGAYNGALDVCTRNGYEWMLLLDDDTEVSADYLSGMLQYRQECNEKERIAAIAPLLHDNAFPLSPQQVLKHRCIPVEAGSSRILEEECFAANSGMMMRTAALVEIGGYSLDFWLDYSDIYVFHQIYAAGKRLYLAADLRLQHSMTMLDYDGRMTPARYTNFLYAEQAFCDLYKSTAQSRVQLLRLLARVFRQRRYRNKAFSRMTWSFLLYRLVTSKEKRLEQWGKRKSLRHASRAPQPAVGG